MRHATPVLVALALAVALVAGSTPRFVGDAEEYVAQAWQFASLRAPSLDARAVADLQARIVSVDDPVRAREWTVTGASVAARDGRRDFVHFWFYPLLATPAVWLTDAVGLHPARAFTLLNLALLALALFVAIPRLSLASVLLVFAGPIVWWLDKPHTEVFTFSLLAVVMLLLDTQPWWALVAAGVAATQNPPIATLLPLILAAAFLADRAVLTDRRLWVGGGVALAFALLHPAYSLAHHGTLSLLSRPGMIRAGLPTLQEYVAVVSDPEIGALGNFPLFAVVIVAGFARVLWLGFRGAHASVDRVTRSPLGGVGVAVVAGAVFLLSFAQTPNPHHGGTPSVSRYALWLIPLAIPVLRVVEDCGGLAWRRSMMVLASVSALVYAFVFHPNVPQNGRQPTLLASYLWTRHPGWNNPLPGVFTEALRPVSFSPMATPHCEKVLLAVGTDDDGWPIPCYPASLPQAVNRPGALLYANRTGARYRFVPAPSRPAESMVRHSPTWSSQQEMHVRALFNEWKWWEMRLESGAPDEVRAVSGVRHVWYWRSPQRLVLVLHAMAPDAHLTLRVAHPAAARFVDAGSGRVVGAFAYESRSGEAREVAVPSGYPLVFLVLEETETGPNR